MRRIRLGSRGSKLALWQANWVRQRIKETHVDIEVEIVKIKTSGDKIKDVPLSQIGGKGLFVKEIEEALLDERIDIAVHSMKDVPTDLPDGLHIASITKREDPRDVLLSRENARLSELHGGARIGTSSLRRKAQLLNIRHDLEIIEIRGNLDTRIKKLEEMALDAIMVAGAGIKRMGLSERVTEYIEQDVILPAIGQGALGIETRVDDEKTNREVEFLNHQETSICVNSERAFLRRLEGGCQVPIAAYGTIINGDLTLIGLVAGINGERVVKETMRGKLKDAENVGITLAERLLDMGADSILKEVYGSKL